MHTNIKILLLLVGAVMLNESVFPTKISKAPVRVQQVCTDYTWFDDVDMTDPTGSISDINVEISRLQGIYVGYTFSSLPGGGLHDFEWGWNPYLPDAIIYSNR